MEPVEATERIAGREAVAAAMLGTAGASEGAATLAIIGGRGAGLRNELDPRVLDESFETRLALSSKLASKEGTGSMSGSGGSWKEDQANLEL
jgi:hypothetical protein